MKSDAIGKLYLVPDYKVIGLYDINQSTNSNGKSRIAIKRKQYVLVLDTNNEDLSAGSFYFKVLSEEGLVWIHNYDLIAVDQKNGHPLYNDSTML